MSVEAVVIVGGARTPVGRFGGSLKDVDASDLAGVAISAALERSGVARKDVDEVIMGQVGQVGGDAYNARRCALAAGIPAAATAMNVNRAVRLRIAGHCQRCRDADARRRHGRGRRWQ